MKIINGLSQASVLANFYEEKVPDSTDELLFDIVVASIELVFR